ncbi:hypothetical protein [Planktotalea arctica]|uniref:hypothetical protein n=1 Tax=Planktotalea arctica TaxID=1481893 RepID=UPI00111C2BA5|nr:hypothetical protein [Planktotalea arctica]
MTSNLCVIGNSHVAALKDGWPPLDGLAHHVRADFFGCLKDGMKSFGEVGGKLGPCEPEAAAFFKGISMTGDFVVPEQYEAFVLTGMKFFPNYLFRNYADFATPSTNNHAFARQFVSDETLIEALWDELKDGMMLHTARTLRAHTDAPIFIVWQPFLSEVLMQIGWREALYSPIIEAVDGAFITRIMAGLDQHLEAEGFQILRQPQETIKDGVMTDQRYSEGSKQFREGGGGEHRALDVFHMNAAFGRACWEHWFSKGALRRAFPTLAYKENEQAAA